MVPPKQGGTNSPNSLPQEIQQSQQQYQQQEYQALVNRVKPKPPVLKNAVFAFLVGGLISMIGQIFMNLFMAGGLAQQEASSATIMVMVFLGAFLTGLGIYDNIGKVAGAGSIIPITGFANSIVSSAMEFKREGFVFGVGARMFNIAGPVLVYGFLISVIVGLIAFMFS
ncbi:stage V sporulation protein AC [Calderihabitans maritimus]|uniref:SpoVA protein n=1 Tax=Calderihabitans maritimus TaxID=1246530 RepID=A0A1Z5HPB2_9FIRM|nr:stage V sporulation protein AC [Calderihabitans maritimus]GAW91353.1 SpoVA protein [Calderihabitans maritimus]